MLLSGTSFANSIKISMNCFIFILSVKIAMSIEIRSSDYYEIIDTTVGMTKSISGFTEKSILQCANECSLLSKCKSFLWDPLSGICTLGSYAVPKGKFNASGSMRLFSQRFECRYDLGYELRSDGETARCLYIGGTTSYYSKARNDCNNRKGRLIKANSRGLVNLVKEMARDKNLPYGWRIFVGLTDIIKEGEHKWSDGQSLTAKETREVFDPREPNDNHGIEDCVEIRQGLLMNDIYCSSRSILFHYACEMIN